ncbi:HAD-IA family hydrolase [Clostridium gasigenes]|uniref:HAD-IA family hydrolase n=1 Tax=Clostridium gasigenes TaxID=94869 RepID=UPI001C0B1C2E|nr:HAD-IA family hydrolase [Clostridium gasigenes]MBU3134089.1 HAD-IA family hydrolase [Clostridium gasigenes]
MSVYKLIDSVEYVSFDIFDTLIKRNIRIPIDVFDLIQSEYNRKFKQNINKFKEKRTSAEKEARDISNKEEISLVNIYEQLRKTYDEKQIDELMTIEKDIEVLICRGNDKVLKLYNYARSINKKIIIISDMYLDRETIERILKINKIEGYEKLYLSSEIGLTKYRGTMYDYVIEDIKYDADKILHIGDNNRSDFKQAINRGLKAYKIENKINLNRTNKYSEIFDEDEMLLNVINAFIDNNLNVSSDKSVYYQIGYRKLGILFYGYLQWIQDYAIKNNLEKLIFFSRDGYVLKEAYDNYFISDNKLITEYMFISRRAVIVPSFNEKLEFDQLIEILGLRKKDTIKSFFRRIGLDYNKYINDIVESGYNVEENIDLINKRSNLEKLFNKIKKDMLINSEEEKKKLVKYIYELGIENKKVGVIDIGWRGSMQYSLMNILKTLNINTDITGFYVGLNKQSYNFIKKGIKAEGYLFSYERNKELEYQVSSFIGLLETFFLAPHGSVIGYDQDKNGNVRPILDELEYTKKDLVITSEVQEGALNFIKDYSIYNKKLKIKVNEHIAFNNISNLGITPSKEYLKMFGDISFSDFDNGFLAKPDKLFKYIMNPNKLIKDFFASQWKVGFLKELFKIPLPYYKIYKIMKNIHEGDE